MRARRHGTSAARIFSALLGMALASGLSASAASAQDGWLGLELRVEGANGAGGGRSGTLVVESVRPDSPADSAGIRANDRLVEIDGSPASEAELDRMRRALDPGDSVSLVLDRAGERIPVVVAAAEAPADVRRRRVAILVPRARRDSVWIDLRLDLDSLQTQIDALNRERLDSIRVRMDSVRVRLGAFDADSMQAFWRGYGDSIQAMVRGIFDSDSIRNFRFFDSDSIRNFWQGVIDSDSIQALVEAWAPSFDSFQYYSPFFAGQRSVAGAELQDLNPSLARYFAVDAGVLVVDVTERSPAAEGGLEPGDVIVEVNGEAVASIREVRAAFSRLSFARARGPDRDTSSEPTVPITVVREGDRVDLELRE
jgi:membrane-associated protease RseP (regulator of RpoE activity)